MKMYTEDGVEVFVTKKIEEGYLARPIYTYNGYDEEVESELEEMGNQVQFFEKLYDKPLIAKYAKEVRDLISEKDKIELEISNLQTIRNKEKYLLSKINKFPILKKLADYLTGDFNFYMDFDRFEIKEKNRVYLPTNVKVTNFKSNGWCLYMLGNENSESYDDKPFMVFHTIDEAVEYSRNKLIERMQEYIRNEYCSSDTLQKEHKRISHTNPVADDAKYLKAYNETLSFLVAREREKEAKKLQDEIEAFEIKKQKLKELSSSNTDAH